MSDSGWENSLPNVGYRYDPVTHLPILSRHDPGVLPESLPPTYRAVGSRCPTNGAPFCVIDNSTGAISGWAGPGMGEGDQ